MVRDTRSFFWEPDAPPEPASAVGIHPDAQPGDNVAPVSAGYLPEQPSPSGRRRRARSSVELLKFLALLLGLAAWNFVPASVVWGACALGLSAVVVWFRWQRVRVFGPVCLFDLVRSGRRARFALLRAGYLVWLLATLATVYAGIFAAAGGVGNIWLQQEASLSLQGAAEFAEAYFNNFAVAQFLAVVVLTPVYVASALPEEKERGTAEALFTTHLEDQEIVLGKMVSRMGHILYLVLAGLPFIAVLQFFGGVASSLIIASFAITLMTVLTLGSLSMWCGARSRTVPDAIIGTYAWALVFLTVSIMLTAMAAVVSLLIVLFVSPASVAAGPWGFGHISSLGNPIATWASLQFAYVAGTGSFDAAVYAILADYVACHLLLTAFCLYMTVRACRNGILAPDAPKPLWRRSGVEFPPRLVRPPLGRWPPLLWKEIHAEAPIGSHRLSAALMFGFRVFGWCLVAGFGLYLIFGVGFENGLEGWATTSEHIRDGVRALGSLLAGSMALVVPIYAAGTIIRERERQTLDGLLTLPVTPTEILFAKWVGAALALRPLWYCLLPIWGVGVLTGSVHILALPLMVLAWLIYAATGSAIGLWFSLRCRSSLRAMLWVVAVILGLVFARSFVLSEKALLLQSWLSPWEAEVVSAWLKYGLLPWNGLAVLTFGYGEWGAAGGYTSPERLLGAGFGLCLDLQLCGVLWFLNRWRWLRETCPARP
jgi:ABC-type transport system involved in multi-copper enzyme maturation permease subunit